MLEVKDLVKIYPGGVPALGQVCLSIPTGLFGLFGPHSAGKTTLFKILAGLLKPTAGNILLDGKKISKEDVHLMTGMELKRRMDMERTHVIDAPVILVDGPGAGMTPEELVDSHELLAEWAESKIVLLASQSADNISPQLSRFAVIRKGTLLGCTTREEVLEELGNAIYEGTVAPDEAQLLQGSELVTQYLEENGHYRLRLFSPSDDVPEGFVLTAPTLQDAYLLMLRLAFHADEEQMEIAC